MSKVMHWSAAYVGLPFRPLGRARAGADCWGLACIVYREQRNIVLPSYDGCYASTDERAEIAAVIDRAVAPPTIWRDSSPDPREFDIAVFRNGRHGSHVGIVLDVRHMLHMAEEQCARIEDYTAPRWASRLVGIYRHAGAAE